MADKEERILITQWNINYDICPAPIEYQCGKSKSCYDCKVGISRQEVIERMKNAGLKYACRANGRDIPEEVHHHYANMMEAALDALLEVK